MEIIDIGLDSLDPISFEVNDRPSVNFGIGAELLMNDKKKMSSSNMNIDLGELDKLESELNELSSKDQKETKTLAGFASNLFNFGSSTQTAENTQSQNAENVTIKIDEVNDSGLGQATAGVFSGFTKTFDGFGKMNDVPFEETQKTSDREQRRKKRMMIKKLEEWYDKGIIKQNPNFNLDSPFDEIEDEYESAMEDKRRKDSIKLQQWWFITFVNSVEYANSTFDPFDVNLDGWGEQVSEDIDSYDEIFSELYHKYKGGKLSPEISIMLRLGFSAAVVNFTNKALSSATPGFNDVIRQSPELMKTFTNATVQAMNQQSPGFQFMNDVMNRDPPINTTFGPPPVAVQTKMPPPSQRSAGGSMNYTQRPDLSASRGGPSNMAPLGTMFHEQGGVDMSHTQEDLQSSNMRPEMRGPQNIDMNQLLQGLKPREVDMYETREARDVPRSSIILEDNESMISASSARALAQNGNKPKRTYRIKSSDKNTVALDI